MDETPAPISSPEAARPEMGGFRRSAAMTAYGIGPNQLAWSSLAQQDVSANTYPGSCSAIPKSR
jgi:hypothetical protein